MQTTVQLCLDDDALTAAVTRRFSNAGWRCVSGPLLETAARHQPDLLIIDARAEFLLGLVKNDPRTSRLTVVAISGFGDADRRQRCLAAGALAVLAQPLDSHAFDAFTTFIEHGRSRAAEATPTSPPPRLAPVALLSGHGR